MIHAQQLGRTFRRSRNQQPIEAVKNLDLNIDSGEVFGFLGPNGAGKTTTVRMLAGLIRPSSGAAHVAGHEVGAENRNIRSNVGVLTEMPGLYDRLSAYQNLEFYAKLHGIGSAHATIEKHLSLLGLWDRRKDPVGKFSKGMRQRVAIARSLMHDPDVVFLDEPTSGLDPESAHTVREFISQLAGEEGRTIFLCTHNLNEAETLCHRIGMMKQTLIKVGTPQQLKRDLFEPQTVLELEGVLPDIETLLDFPFVNKIEANGTRVVVTLDDPDTHNPALIERLVSHNARIRYVRPQERSLEEVYLTFVKEAE
jgi:ABC-2 type transport system ATP-binding protein